MDKSTGTNPWNKNQPQGAQTQSFIWADKLIDVQDETADPSGHNCRRKYFNFQGNQGKVYFWPAVGPGGD